MCKGDVIVCDVVEEVDLGFVEQQRSGDGMHRCVAPTLVEETAFAIEEFEIIEVGLGAEPIQIADFEIRPL